MVTSELLAILRFLEETRTPGLRALGMDARDPLWMMTIALLRRYYSKQRITISSLAQSSGSAHATAIRLIERMIEAGLVRRRRERDEPKLVYIEPTDELLRNFVDYCKLFKTKVGTAFGLDHRSSEDFVFGAAHLAARIIPPPSKPVPPLSLDGPLRVLLTNEPTLLVLKRMSAEIASFLNVPIEIDVLDYETLNRKVIENGRLEVSEYDLIAVDAPWLGRMAIEGIILPLDDEIQRSRLNPFDFYTAAWEAAQCIGQHWGLMLAPTVELLLYRRDIFEKWGLEAPRTADEVVAAARRAHDPGRDVYGIAWNAARGQPLGQTFMQIMAAFGAPPISLRQYGPGYDLDTPWDQLRPTLNNPAGQRTLEYLVELAEFSPPNISMMDWSARTTAYRMGRAAMAYEWSGRTMEFESDPESPARGNTSYLPHPSMQGDHGVSPMGGWLLAIPVNIPRGRKRGAWRVLQWLVSPEFTKCLIQHGSQARFLHSLSNDPEIPRLSPALDAVDALQRSGRLQVWSRPPIPYITSMMRTVGEEIHDVIWGGAPFGEALLRTENRLKPMFDTLAEDYKNSYKTGFYKK